MLILLNKLLQYINLFKFNFINTNKFLEMFKVFKEKKKKKYFLLNTILNILRIIFVNLI